MANLRLTGLSAKDTFVSGDQLLIWDSQESNIGNATKRYAGIPIPSLGITSTYLGNSSVVEDKIGSGSVSLLKLKTSNTFETGNVLSGESGSLKWIPSPAPTETSVYGLMKNILVQGTGITVAPTDSNKRITITRNALNANDIPNISANILTSGIVDPARLGQNVIKFASIDGAVDNIGHPTLPISIQNGVIGIYNDDTQIQSGNWSQADKIYFAYNQAASGTLPSNPGVSLTAVNLKPFFDRKRISGGSVMIKIAPHGCIVGNTITEVGSTGVVITNLEFENTPSSLGTGYNWQIVIGDTYPIFSSEIVDKEKFVFKTDLERKRK